MFLKSLKIENDGCIIREILFHKGVNLIVDDTKPEEKTGTGNNVGKTTVLRLIDFCLAGNGKNIYVDPEFKGKSNEKVERFLKENNILITLTLTPDLKSINNVDEIVIERNFLSYGKKVQKINGKAYTNSDFKEYLKKLIFKTDSEKPGFRQLISKNIRDEKNRLINTMKVLNMNTRDVEYEMLFLFWMGFDTDLSKDKLVRDRNTENQLQKRLRKGSNLAQINQSLKVINKEIVKLEEKKDNFNLNEEFEEDLNKLNKIKSNINYHTSQISRLELRKDLISESKANLEGEKANIDTDQIQALYNKAKILIPNLQKTFEQTLSFHNEMVEQRISYITEELPALEKDLRDKGAQLTQLITKERELSEKLNKSGVIEDLQSIINELNNYYKEKGKFEEQKHTWEDSNNALKQIDAKLKKIEEYLLSKDEKLQESLGKFNVFYSDIYKRLNGVNSVLSAEIVNGIYKFEITDVDLGNPGTGGKKTQIQAFDLAYIEYADSQEIPCLHFILLDQIENVHDNQISNLFTEIVEEVNCQYVLSVLRDKLPEDIDVDRYEVLKLSQQDKLFKLE